MECSWSPWEGVGECKVLPSIDVNEIGSNQEDRQVQQLPELKIEIQEARECLRNAQDKLAQESSKDSSHSISRSQCSHNHPIQVRKED